MDGGRERDVRPWKTDSRDLSILVKALTLAGLIAVMFSMGLKVNFAEVLASARQPRLVVLGLLANFVLIPAVTVGLLNLFEAAPLVSVGFLILAVCPGAPVAPPFAAIARGDVPSAIGLMVILAGFSTVLAPALLSLLAPRFLPGSDLRGGCLAIARTLLIAQMVPLAIGLSIHHGLPRLTQRCARPVELLANLLLVVVILLLLTREYQTLAMIHARGWFGMLLLLTASLGIGWLCGGPGRAARKTLAVTTASRNAAVGLVIVSNNFPNTPAVTALIAYSLISLIGTLGCSLALARSP